MKTAGRKWVQMCAIALVAVLAAPLMTTVDAQLSATFYNSRCPKALTIISAAVKSHIVKDRTLAPSLLRLHFHDCFVRGCDASVLLNSVAGALAEKDSFGNKNSLRGFNVIDDVKAQLEAACPGVVSCADILALAARDAMQDFGGVGWNVLLGRRDGVVSSASEANSNLPPPFFSFQQLVTLFQNKGFSAKEMITLSGSHTVGMVHCSTFQSRLYNFSRTVKTDPSMNAAFAAKMKTLCKFGDGKTTVHLDQSLSVDTWDSKYYDDVQKGRVLLATDQALSSTSFGRSIVSNYNRSPSPFNSDFSAAMTKLSSLGVLTGSKGQIRKKCGVKN